MKKFFLVIFIIFYVKNMNADISQEVQSLKNEFKQIKEIYESKIEALEAKIEKLENEKIEHQQHATDDKNKMDSHQGHNDHSLYVHSPHQSSKWCNQPVFMYG